MVTEQFASRFAGTSIEELCRLSESAVDPLNLPDSSQQSASASRGAHRALPQPLPVSCTTLQDVIGGSNGGSMTFVKCVFFAVLLLVTSSFLSAQVPANDDFDSATDVATLPFEDSIDASQATSAADDPMGDEAGFTVWYSFTAPSDMLMEANTFGSDFDTVLAVWTGARGALQLVEFDDDTVGLQSRVRFSAAFGTTYHLMAASYSDRAGGNLVFFMDLAPPLPPPLEFEFGIDPVGSFAPRAGLLKVTGTVYTSRFAEVWITGEVRQRVGRRAVLSGRFSASVESEGETSWHAYAVTGEGFFSGGPVEVTVQVYIYDPERDEYFEDEASLRILTRGGGR
jgi:hypothetical protein